MPLAYFIFGLICAVFVFPTVQSIADVICSHFEVVKSKMSVKITENNCAITKLNMEVEPVSTHAIGFEIPRESDLYEDVEEECRSSSSSPKNNMIGFQRGEYGK